MTFTALKIWFSQQVQSKFNERESVQVLKQLLTHLDSQHRNWTTIITDEELLKSMQVQLKETIVNRLIDDEPLAYILGQTFFYGLPFTVDSHVLIPRPETEELVDWILEVPTEMADVLDIGTGSGCIAIALANNRKEWKVDAIDINIEALSIAKRNAEQNEVSIHLMELDILQEDLPRQYDIIVSNPPYISSDETSRMSPSTVKFEPSLALFTQNNDPLQFYKRIGEIARKALKSGGRLYFELNEYFAEETKHLLLGLGYKVEIKKDLQGKNRMAKCQLL
ncbi:MAG: peptide chain release factor N(5)-glutamine methyltransferase [Chitinophagales bacterium]